MIIKILSIIFILINIFRLFSFIYQFFIVYLIDKSKWTNKQEFIDNVENEQSSASNVMRDYTRLRCFHKKNCCFSVFIIQIIFTIFSLFYLYYTFKQNSIKKLGIFFGILITLFVINLGIYIYFDLPSTRDELMCPMPDSYKEIINKKYNLI
tara:strand:- start:412 stop:867 length:456 start_codon:yes stop_codon:yes gene_type:complete